MDAMLFSWVRVPLYERKQICGKEDGEVAKDNRYTNRYIELHQHQVKLKINEITEPELLKWVTSRKNIQGYIKYLIRKDMWENGLLDSLDPLPEGGDPDE